MPTNTQNLFDLGEEYASMLTQGIRLSGEDQQFFIRGRLRYMAENLDKRQPRRILDFGCGIGVATAVISEIYPGAKVLGIDTAAQAIAYANRHYENATVHFQTLDRFEPDGSFDLCYCNGVFHHIPPAERRDAANLIYRALTQGGRLALFENNPLNPGTRAVMSRIPFDREAVLLQFWEARRLLKGAGFDVVLPARFLFYFPRVLAALRFTERLLVRLPLGAQYCVTGIKG
ncbi:MAG: class I SAM-dependent methyltransferase [Acidobacteriia bacterium]|nr:class I SAM-dependent methyltransferase [Terriglobia bacterium]